MELAPHEIIKRPIVTEKSTHLGTMGQYVFEVHPRANKDQVRAAVEWAFPVRVKAVNTLWVREKSRQANRHRILGRSWKKAIVTLREGRIELFPEV